LHNAITNVTTGTNIQTRENAGDINAYGIEADARYRINDNVSLTAAFDDVNATINGLQPAQAPRWTVTGGVEVRPLRRLTLFADVRYESRRFADDLNTIPLNAGATIDTRVSYAILDAFSLYVYCDNLFNTKIASTAAVQPLITGPTDTGLVTNWVAPRMIGAGVSFAQ
jgi:outer membrane receptor protein involved in Fe transport